MRTDESVHKASTLFNLSNWINALLNIMILILGSALITIGENIKGFGIKQIKPKHNRK